MQASSSIKLEVQTKQQPEDENDSDSNKTLHNIPDSLALLHSLRQSRNAWLRGALPKFSSKAKGLHQTESSICPHDIRSIARCDLTVGPHTFPDTNFFEVQYQSDSLSQLSQHETNMVSAPNSQTGNADSESLDSSIHVTPALIAQVNLAAASDPTLQNLLQVAAAGKASVDQLKSLGIFIQTLALNAQSSAASGSSETSPDTPAASRPNEKAASQASSNEKTTVGDIVIEFRENNKDRWLLPRDNLVCRRQSSNSYHYTNELILSFTLSSTDTEVSSGNKEESSTVVRPVTFRLSKVSYSLWKIISNWAGSSFQSTEAQAELQKIISSLPPRVYLKHRLADSPLLTQLQSVGAAYPLKHIKAVPSGELTKPKRPPRRKPITGNVPKKRPAVAQREERPSSKMLRNIVCLSCGKSNIPLVYGGLYCRPCVDVGRAPDIVIPASAMSQSIQRLSNRPADHKLLGDAITTPAYRIPSFKPYKPGTDPIVGPSVGSFAINSAADSTESTS